MQKTPFVVLEGIDGAGTTTQTARLVAQLRTKKLRAKDTREPSDGPVGMLLRQILRGRIVAADGTSAASFAELALLFAADRLDHLAAEVRPALADGTVVVSDRYDYSSVAYQSASAKDTAIIPWLREVNRFAQRPDLTVVIDVSPEVARGRRALRAGAREIFDDDAFQAHLAAFYAGIDAYFPDDRIVHIAGDGPADEVAEAVFRAVLPLVQVL